mgnify:CR=1 FL=1|jgi:hypothetical protein|nr:MAG TPA: hypothetical protein [Caudoviricetes sp.]
MIKPYIKSETAEEIICSICDRMYPGMDCEPADCEWMKMLAEESVDAVPVVRCKDCKYLVNATVNSNGFLICNATDMEIAPEDFCSYGERRAEKEPPEEGET